jgi:hypothetical protein
MVMGGGS